MKCPRCLTLIRSHRLAGVLILAAVAAAPAAEFYVDASNAGTGLGTRQSPFSTVQAAIDAASDGDVIRVAADTYVENLRIQGKAIVLEGGYSSAWARDVAANSTTLSGAGGNAVINLIEADATVDGFRITGGTGSIEELPYGYHGGGIYSRDGSPTISNNIIEGNDIRSVDPPSDYNLGGGVHVSNAAMATITDNVIRGNYAGRGAGISVGGQAALIQSNTIENNVAVGDHGGGMFIAVVDARVTQNIIRGNEVGRDLSYGWGGGLIIVNEGNFAELSFNTVYENFAAAYGAGEFIDEGARADIHHELIYRNESKGGCEAVSAISVDGGDGIGSQATISHCTIVDNVCANATRGNGLQVEGLSVVSVTNSIFWNNGGDDFSIDNTSTLSVSYTLSQESIAGVGNISAEPRFENEVADDYHLAAGSPAIDAGDPASPFDDEPADNGGRADMGRYGNATDVPSTDGSNDNSSGGGGSDNGNANSGNDNNSNDNANGDGGGPPTPPRTGGVCGAVGPPASVMLLFLSLFAAGRARRRQW